MVALLSVAAWSAAGATAATRRRLASGLLVAAVLVTAVRVTTVAMLAGQGWWFVQEKVLLGLPMLGAAGLAAVLVAGPRLLAARRAPEAGIQARCIVSMLAAGYAALAGLVVTFLVGYPLTWSTALIASSLVCAGTVLTARVVAAPVDTTDTTDAAAGATDADDTSGDADVPPTHRTGSPGSRAAGSSAWRVEHSLRVLAQLASACCSCRLNPSLPEAAPAGTKVRLRLINTDSDPHRFALPERPSE